MFHLCLSHVPVPGEPLLVENRKVHTAWPADSKSTEMEGHREVEVRGRIGETFVKNEGNQKGDNRS